MFQNSKTTKPPAFSNSNKSPEDSAEVKRAKLEIFYSYHLGSLYRQLKVVPFQVQAKKLTSLQNVQAKSQEDCINTLYKYAILNSKYRHRQKVRFERTPLLKFLKYDFSRIRELSKQKQFALNYQDLHDQDESDEDEEKKKAKQFQLEPGFNQISIETYKKKNDIKGKVFIILGYQDLKQVLMDDYNWEENTDLMSKNYDLKFVSRKKHIDYVNLLNSQYINHFQQNKSITAKFGLCRNIRNLSSVCKNPNVFFPRCYDINDVTELQDFYEDFKMTKVKCILLQYIKEEKGLSKSNLKIVSFCIELLQRQLLSIDAKINMLKKGKLLGITLEEWNIINQFKIQQTNQEVQQIFDQQLRNRVIKIYQSLKAADPQLSLNSQNVWIVKPASLSRGRGIKTFNHLNQIFDYIIGCEISWVVQKYIERPLIVRRKKFDIRQWVLWTDFKPLRAWLFQEAYIRFCAQIYSPQNLKNRKIHLTNNSVTKGINSQNDGIEGNMMDEQQFSIQLQKMFGKNIYREVIKPQMKKIVYQSLESVLQNVQYRKNSFEILGYDFMIDEDFKVWLIQVNSSPTMEYSTAVTTKLVKRAMHDLGGVIQHYIMRGKQYNKKCQNKEYGGWQLINN